MKYEKSCGGIIFTRKDNTVHYLVVRHLGGHWGFPKGHMDPGETEEETALREIREEVGLTVTLMNGFRTEETYQLPNKPDTQKTVVYFLAEFADQTVQIQPEEVTEASLVPYEEAMKLLTHQEVKNLLIQADQYICSQ